MADTVNKTRLVAKTAKIRSAKIDVPPEPQKLGNYTLTTRLGSGGMGSVYRAHDDKLDRTVAIKVMLAKVGNTPEVMSAFRREAQAAAKLNHPNIAQIYSFGEESGRPYIAMEYVSGDHFDKLIQREEPLDQAMVMKIGMDIAGGLAVAADASLIHGDIKPENIVFDDHGVPKLLDFGIALASNAKTTEIWGTPYYIAPEKIKKHRIDFRSDIYCLGGTLYHALTKHPPFDGDDVKEVVKARLVRPPEPLSTYRPDIDPEVEAIILRMLQVEPADRYPTYGALLNDIRKYLRRVRPQMIPVTTEMLFVTTQFIADAAAEKAAAKPKKEKSKAQSTPEKPGKKHLFSDFKSQLLLLLALVAFFPYFVIFYTGIGGFSRSDSGSSSYAKPAATGKADVSPPAAVSEPPVVKEVKPAVPPPSSPATPAATGSAEVSPPAAVSEPPVVKEVKPAVPPPLSPVTPAATASAEVPPPAAVPEPPVVKEVKPAVPPPSSPVTPAATASAEVPSPAAVPEPSVAKEVKPNAPSPKIVELPSVYDGPRQIWPELKVTAIMGSGKGGSALVNGDVVTVGFTMQSGVKLIAVGTHYAEFLYKGEYKRVVVTAPPKKQQAAASGKKKGR